MSFAKMIGLVFFVNGQAARGVLTSEPIQSSGIKMASFLITFKPVSENPERGWPLSELQKLVRRLRKGDAVEEKWRFNNRKDVALGDRAFLLLQGKSGPAIIGYGRVSAEPNFSPGKNPLL